VVLLPPPSIPEHLSPLFARLDDGFYRARVHATHPNLLAGLDGNDPNVALSRIGKLGSACIQANRTGNRLNNDLSISTAHVKFLDRSALEVKDAAIHTNQALIVAVWKRKHNRALSHPIEIDSSRGVRIGGLRLTGGLFVALDDVRIALILREGNRVDSLRFSNL